MTPDHTPRAVPEVLSAEEERVSRMQIALGAAGVLASGINSWSAAAAVLAHLDALDAARGSSEGPGLREALGPKREVSGTSQQQMFTHGWNDCRDFVLRTLDRAADRSHEGLDVENDTPSWQRSGETNWHNHGFCPECNRLLGARLRGTPE